MKTITQIWKHRVVVGINYRDEHNIPYQISSFVNYNKGMDLKKQLTAMRKRLEDDEIIEWFRSQYLPAR